ncbi:MAG: glycosyltransferase [Bacteroidales bacterium]|jgi:glycosyltransferase involved in cell wall biosynthesis|nr:glycosyltransferase [Bacteroidales bacterium]
MQSDKYTILFLSSWYPTRLFPFRGDFVKRHAQAVGFYNKVICLHVIQDKKMHKKSQRIEKRDQENLIEIIIYFKKKSLGHLSYLFHYLKGFRYIHKRFGNPDLIHGNVLYPIGSVVFMLSVFYKIPYLFTEHWTGFLNGTYQRINFFKRRFYNYIGKKAKKVMPVTANLMHAMIDSGINADYRVVPNVVDTKAFKHLLPAGKREKKILHVSNIRDKHKNISGLLRSISKLRFQRQDFMLNIIHSEENNYLKDLSDSLGLTGKYVFFCGKKTYYEVAEYMRQSAFLVLFSNYENLPCVIVEAFAAGLPVLSTDVGGIREHLDRDKGVLIEKGNEEQLIGQLNFMLDHYQDFDKQLLANYAFENFSFMKVGEKYHQIYQEILNV